MRIVIMGTGPFALPTAQALVDDGHHICLVVTRPTATPVPKKPPPRPVYEWVRRNRLESVTLGALGLSLALWGGWVVRLRGRWNGGVGDTALPRITRISCSWRARLRWEEGLFTFER